MSFEPFEPSIAIVGFEPLLLGGFEPVMLQKSKKTSKNFRFWMILEVPCLMFSLSNLQMFVVDRLTSQLCGFDWLEPPTRSVLLRRPKTANGPVGDCRAKTPPQIAKRSVMQQGSGNTTGNQRFFRVRTDDFFISAVAPCALAQQLKITSDLSCLTSWQRTQFNHVKPGLR